MPESNATQGSELLVEAVITRLEPCPEHEAEATGKHVYRLRRVQAWTQEGEDGLVVLADDAVIVANPNGYRHDCEACQNTPKRLERIPDIRSIQ